jgi:sigma-B regulation protein RsbU (phosphoserine phosphatase)
MSITGYEHFDVELEPGDCIVTYTDALIESSDANGEMLGEEGVLRLLKLLGDIKPEKLIESLLGEIKERYPENLSNDDVTLMILRANGAGTDVHMGRQNAHGGANGWRRTSFTLSVAEGLLKS